MTIVVVVVVILMAFLANLYPLRQLLYGYPILLYGVMLSIACACLLKWEETGVPGGNPRKHGENMQTPHRKARAGPETNPGPSCCEATALTTAPPCDYCARLNALYRLGVECGIMEGMRDNRGIMSSHLG